MSEKVETFKTSCICILRIKKKGKMEKSGGA